MADSSPIASLIDPEDSLANIPLPRGEVYALDCRLALAIVPLTSVIGLSPVQETKIGRSLVYVCELPQRL